MSNTSSLSFSLLLWGSYYMRTTHFEMSLRFFDMMSVFSFFIFFFLVQLRKFLWMYLQVHVLFFYSQIQFNGSEEEFKMTKVNMLRTLIEKVDNMQI